MLGDGGRLLAGEGKARTWEREKIGQRPGTRSHSNRGGQKSKTDAGNKTCRRYDMMSPTEKITVGIARP